MLTYLPVALATNIYRSQTTVPLEKVTNPNAFGDGREDELHSSFSSLLGLCVCFPHAVLVHPCDYKC